MSSHLQSGLGNLFKFNLLQYLPGNTRCFGEYEDYHGLWSNKPETKGCSGRQSRIGPQMRRNWCMLEV